MQVKDDDIFREYHEIRIHEHIPIQRFIDEHHIVSNTRKFYNKYREWLIENNLEYPFWSATEYIRWYSKHYDDNTETLDKCIEMERMISVMKIPHNPLIMGASIYYMVTGRSKRELSVLAGVSTRSITKCVNWISGLRIAEQDRKNECELKVEDAE